MQNTKSFGVGVSDRYRLPVPTLLSSVGKSPPITFSRIRCDTPEHGRTKPAPSEDAYAVQVMLQDVPHVQLWTHGRETHVPYVKRGGILILHFESDPFTAFHSPFDLMNVYFSKATLDELAEGAGGRKSAGLRRPDYGVPDQMLYHLAASVLPFFHRSAASDQMILDHIALAFHARLASEYSGAPVDVRLSQGGLAPWQARRAKDFIEADLTRGPTLLEIADECGLSASHFSRAFRKTTGRPPHRWLLERRVDAAKGHLVDPDLALSDIAKLCGFSDPSHFSRVFSKSTGETPGSWRRGRHR